MSAGIRHISGTVSIETRGAGFYGVGSELQRFLARQGAGSGLLSVFCTHTSASLCVQENADPDVLADLSAMLKKLAPEGAHYRHRSEGPDDMPAHIKSMLLGVSLTLPVSHGTLALGAWQGIYLNEHRDHANSRHVVVTVIGS